MKLVKQSVEPIKQDLDKGLQGIYEVIAFAASTCYKSEPKQQELAKKFVENLIANGHTAMLEFGTVYLRVPLFSSDVQSSEMFQFYNNNPYSKVGYFIHNKEGNVVEGELFVTTNYRVIVENERQKDLEFLDDNPFMQEKVYSFKLNTSIGIARELTRHRHFSFAQESTRFVNYNKDKFGNQITYIIPSWADKLKEYDKLYGIPYINIDNVERPEIDNAEWRKYFDFLKGCKEAETSYLGAIHRGLKTEEARDLLPLATKTEICVSGFESDWKHFFDLRLYGTTGRPHPDMKVLAEMIKSHFPENLYYNDNRTMERTS